MQKMVVLLRRAAGMTKEEFEQWWLGGHADMVRRFPGLLRYSVNIFEDPLPNSEDADWDGIAELWYEDRAAVDRAYESEIARRGMADTAAHLDAVARMVTTEHVIDPIPDGESDRLPTGEWFAERVTSLQARNALVGMGGTLDASIRLDVTGKEPVWLRLFGGEASTESDEDFRAEAHYNIRGPATGWRKLLTGQAHLVESVSAFGELKLSGELVKAAGDMWGLTKFFAAVAGTGAAV
jgi:uncharacterized protein (TIGR02118 family)